METFAFRTENDCLLDVKDLIAASVHDAEGHFVGRIEDIVIDARSGCIRHAVLVVGGVLGIGGTRLAVTWRALTPDVNARRCIVDRTLMQLTAVPLTRRAASSRKGISIPPVPTRGREQLGTP
jgi:sporulation protein YlmC with PRC-barrel domain